MQEHEYKARDRTTKKMSRDGLLEENLKSGETVRISPREPDNRPLPQGENTSEHHLPQEEDKPEEDQRRKRYSRLSRSDDVRDNCPDNDLSETAMKKFEYSAGEEPNNNDSVLSKEDGRNGLSGHSSRMEGVWNQSSGSKNFVLSAAEVHHIRKKKQVQEYAKKEKTRNQEAGESKAWQADGDRDTQKRKQKREQRNKEQKKKSGRLLFEDEDTGMVRGSGMGITKKAVSAAVGSAGTYVHSKGHEAEQENAAVEGTHKAELLAENALRYAMHKTRRSMHKRSARLKTGAATQAKERLRFESVQEAGETVGKQAAKAEQAKKSAMKRLWQKRRYQKAYQNAKKGEKTAAGAARSAQTFLAKAKSVATSFVKSHKGMLGSIAGIILILVLIATSLSSCTVMLRGGVSAVVGTTYPSTDEDIYAVEAAYAALEHALNNQINHMESTHPDYDEYRYRVDEISHNPYHLISYFTAKYGEFTYEQVAEEIEDIFREQYSLNTEATRETVTETKMVRVGESLGQVVTSGYCSCSVCCGIWSGGPTASGVYPTANHTIAVDASNPFVPMGTKVVMNGVEYVVEDTGGFARYGVQFDIYYGDHASASAHGHQTWEAYIADSNGSQEVEVTTTSEVNRLDIMLTNHSLDAVLRSRMDTNEEKRYDIYNTTYGNRDYLFDTTTLPGGGDAGGFGYEIPAEALSDEKFARMIREAEKYLGYPYVWGGASPSTSFDCSGFVSWVINNCGNGWNVGRQTAEGLRGCCAYVSPSEAKPGDLIFFQGTYNTTGASHVGIYVGDNMMIHCGNPIQYANINSAYWQQHFMAFGRIQ